jgi:hypothetical protein
VLVAPLLLYGAALRASLARDIASLAGSQPPPRAAVEARVAACGRCGIDALVQALAGPAPVPAMNLLARWAGRRSSRRSSPRSTTATRTCATPRA